MEKKAWKIDVNVLLIFFVRDDVFAKTFAAVKEARPRRLLLYQDGPRDGRPDDLDGIRRCREIAMDIDWDCEVHTNFQDSNWGCDPATFYSHKWAFSLVDKCIILEDDCVASQSFFPFCKELLDKYENDTRINRICGMNNLGYSEDCKDDYFFAFAGSVWGWASWRRVAELWEEDYAFFNDSDAMDKLKELNKKNEEYRVKQLWHRDTGKPYWETVNSYARILNSQLVIVPNKNLISNIGITENATHAMADIRVIPKKSRSIFYMETYEYDFPLKHPKYVVCDSTYLSKIRLRSFSSKIESIYLRIKYGYTKDLIKSVKRKLFKKK